MYDDDDDDFRDNISEAAAARRAARAAKRAALDAERLARVRAARAARAAQRRALGPLSEDEFEQLIALILDGHLPANSGLRITRQRSPEQADRLAAILAGVRSNGAPSRASQAMALAVQMAAERGGDPQHYLREAWDHVLTEDSDPVHHLSAVEVEQLRRFAETLQNRLLQPSRTGERRPPANPRARMAMLLAVQMAAERGGDPQDYLREAWEQTVRGNGAYVF